MDLENMKVARFIVADVKHRHCVGIAGEQFHQLKTRIEPALGRKSLSQ